MSKPMGRVLCAVLGLAALGTSSSAWAIKPFALVEDGYAEAPKQLEYENTFTWDHKIGGDKGFNQYSNESEFEYGVTDNFTFRVKGAGYYQDSKDFTGSKFDDGGLEVQYYFTNPNTDNLGVSVITAALFGEGTFASENFLVIQKDFSKWVVAYNLGGTVEVDGFAQGGSKDTTLTVSNSIGAAYALDNKWKIGADASLETSFNEFFRHKQDTTLYAGPVINWVPNDKLWITVGCEFEVLRETHDAPQFQLTVIVGYYF